MRKPTPANITLAVAALTFLFQGLPPIIEANEFISHKTASFVATICDILNVFVSCAAIFFGVKK
jgi:hypothetical protein